ncbi:MAG: UbiA family prenyltransferase [Planctomycetota bacterium]
MLPNASARLLTAARLLGMTRLGLVLSGVSGAWLMTFLAFGVEAEKNRSATLAALGIGWGLLMSAGAALGLGVCAVALNDVLDRRQDRLLADDVGGHAKPVASGRVSPQTATAVAVGASLLSVLCAAALGPTSLRLAVLLGAAVLFYNVAGRFVPAVGVVTLGLIHGLALAIPNPLAGFAWPVLLTMTHVMTTGLVRHHLESKRPRVKPADVWLTLIGWGFWSMVVLVLIRYRQGGVDAAAVTPWIWVGPAAAVVGFTVLAVRVLRQGGAVEPALRARRFRRLSVGWLFVYDIAWLASAGLWWQGLVIAGLLGLALLGLGGAHPTRKSRGSFIDELTSR